MKKLLHYLLLCSLALPGGFLARKYLIDNKYTVDVVDSDHIVEHPTLDQIYHLRLLGDGSRNKPSYAVIGDKIELEKLDNEINSGDKIRIRDSSQPYVFIGGEEEERLLRDFIEAGGITFTLNEHDVPWYYRYLRKPIKPSDIEKL